MMLMKRVDVIAGLALMAFVWATTPCAVAAGESWRPPSATLISNNDGSLYCIEYPGHTVAIHLNGPWGCSSRSSANAASKTFQTDVTLQVSGAQAKDRKDVTLKCSSSDPSKFEINSTAHAPIFGTVFHVYDDAKVVQLPFQPLKPSQEYLTVLNQYFAR